MKTGINLTSDPIHDVMGAARCKRMNIVHYSGKSYSDKFAYPCCGREARFNLNYLGRKKVYCDGQRFLKLERYEVSNETGN